MFYGDLWLMMVVDDGWFIVVIMLVDECEYDGEHDGELVDG